MSGMTAADPGRSHLTRPLLLLLVLAAFSFGAIVKVAWATAYHTTCVGHGFVAGADPNDGSFFSRVEAGCGSTARACSLYTSGILDGGQSVSGTTATCNAWSRDYGSFSECNSTAHVDNPGVFSEHYHVADNYCG